MKTNRVLLISILVCSIVSIISCSETLDNPLVDNDLVPIELTPATRSFVEEGNQFAFKLLQKVAEQEKGNFMISPLGVTLAFGLAMEAGEESEAMSEVRKVLGFENGSREEIREYCATMLERLPRMDKLANVSIANMVLLNNRFGSVNPSFSKAVLGYHNALVKDMSFSSPLAVVDQVNKWAKQNTNGMIENAITKEDISSMTTAILSNALYFNGKWTSKFKKSDTKKEEFTLGSGEIREVDMMRQETELYFRQLYVKRFLPQGGEQSSVAGGIVRMMYGNGAFAMDLYLPHDTDEGLDALMTSLIEFPERYNSWATPKTNLWLPKFELKEKRIEMKEVLEELGMKKAMSEGWLSYFDNNSLSSIDKVFQNAAIKVDESGTEAAAVTEIVHYDTSPGFSYSEANHTLIFHCDHPFLYTISETSTGAILFAGIFRGE